jgi:hypothetical protein
MPWSAKSSATSGTLRARLPGLPHPLVNANPRALASVRQKYWQRSR